MYLMDWRPDEVNLMPLLSQRMDGRKDELHQSGDSFFCLLGKIKERTGSKSICRSNLIPCFIHPNLLFHPPKSGRVNFLSFCAKSDVPVALVPNLTSCKHGELAVAWSSCKLAMASPTASFSSLSSLILFISSFLPLFFLSFFPFLFHNYPFSPLILFPPLSILWSKQSLRVRIVDEVEDLEV